MVAAIILAVLNAIAAIPKFVGYAESIGSAITGWYVARQKRDTLVMIADAAAFAARAESEDDRYEASQKWLAALSRSRTG